MDADTTQEFEREEILQALREQHAELARIRKLLEPMARMFEIFDNVIRWWAGKLRER